jgi:hypothetical protein
MIRWLVILAFAWVAFFSIKKHFFPSDQQRIQKRLEEIAQLLTKPQGESVIATANKVSDALNYFQPPVTVTLNNDVLTERQVTEHDRNGLKNSLTGLRFQYAWMDVSFEDVLIEVKGNQAQVSAVGRLEFPSEQQGLVYDLYQLTMVWVRVEGDWLISKLDVSKRNE